MPEARVVPVYSAPSLGLRDPDIKGTYRYLRDFFYYAGVDSHSSPPMQNEDLFEKLDNIMPPTHGNLRRRWGYTYLLSPGNVPRFIWILQRDADGLRYVVYSSTSSVYLSYENGSQNPPVAFLFTPNASATFAPRMVGSRSFGYFYDGAAVDLMKWNGNPPGTGLFKWGIDPPGSALTVGAPVSGNVTLTLGRRYYTAFRNSATGGYSGLSPISASTGPLSARNIPLSALPVSTDPQVDRKVVLATGDGNDATTLYMLADIPNAQTTLTDDIDLVTLLGSNIFLETDATGIEHGVADNTPPPNGQLCVKHRGRLFMLNGQALYFSKSIGECTTSTGIIAGVYEECWPAENLIDISEGAESGRGLLSDGTSLWIGTERHIRRLDGTSVLDFTSPSVVFNEVGLLNQEVWKMVFSSGQALGTCWLTPDFKVMFSDFNTYQNIGEPIQDLLDSINPAAASKAHAAFQTRGEFSEYTLYIPTGSNTDCDTAVTFDLKLKQWFVWHPADKIVSSLFNVDNTGNPQWLFGATTGKVYYWDHAATQDRKGDTPVAIASSIRTSWLSLGDPTLRKLLNEIEVITGDTSGLHLTIEAASTDADFSSPTVLVNNSTLTQNPFGTWQYKLFAAPSKHRFYRFTFSSTGSVSNILDAYNIEAIPWNRF